MGALLSAPEPASATQVYNLRQETWIDSAVVDLRPEGPLIDGAVRWEAVDSCVPNRRLRYRVVIVGGSPTAQRRATRRLRALSNVARVLSLSGAALAEFERRYAFLLDPPPKEQGRIFASEVAERVFISSYAVATEAPVLRALNIGTIINVTPDHPLAREDDPAFAHVHHLRVPLFDDRDAQIHEHFEATTALIERASTAADGRGVLVHCRHGQSRSATILAAWLVQARGMGAAEAVAHLQACRSKVSPNEGFVGQLSALG